MKDLFLRIFIPKYFMLRPYSRNMHIISFLNCKCSHMNPYDNKNMNINSVLGIKETLINFHQDKFQILSLIANICTSRWNNNTAATYKLLFRFPQLISSLSILYDLIRLLLYILATTYPMSKCSWFINHSFYKITIYVNKTNEFLTKIVYHNKKDSSTFFFCNINEAYIILLPS